MYIVTTCTYPSDKAKEVAQRYVKSITKFPDDASLGTFVVQGAVRGTLQGLSVMIVFEPKKGKFEEAYALGVSRLAMFHDIPGFEYDIKAHYSLEEAMKVIGM